VLVKTLLGKKPNKASKQASELIGSLPYYYNDSNDRIVTFQLEQYNDTIGFSVHLSGKYKLLAFGMLYDNTCIMDMVEGTIGSQNQKKRSTIIVRNNTKPYFPIATDKVYIVDALNLPDNNAGYPIKPINKRIDRFNKSCKNPKGTLYIRTLENATTQIFDNNVLENRGSKSCFSNHSNFTGEVAKEYLEYQMIPSSEQSIAPQNSQIMNFNNYSGQIISKDEESDIEETEEFEEMEFDKMVFDKEDVMTKLFFSPLESTDKNTQQSQQYYSKTNDLMDSEFVVPLQLEYSLEPQYMFQVFPFGDDTYM